MEMFASRTGNVVEALSAFAAIVFIGESPNLMQKPREKPRYLNDESGFNCNLRKQLATRNRKPE